MSASVLMYFLRELFLIKTLAQSWGGMAGRVQVGGVGGDKEIWTQFSICLGADYFH